MARLSETSRWDTLTKPSVAAGGLGRLSHKDALARLARQAHRRARAVETASVRFPLPAMLSLCLPAFNEQENIVAAVSSALAILPHFVEQFEIVVVDDGSWDTTAWLVAEMERDDHRVRLVRHERNRGYGAAVTTGLRAADGELVMFADSDGQFDFLDVAHLLAALPGVDLVAGYRRPRSDDWRRRLNGWLWGRLVRAMLGVRSRDLDCAFKLFRHETLERLQLTAEGACINAEIMAQCHWGGLKWREVPVKHLARRAGKPTGAHLGVIVKALRELPRLRCYRRVDGMFRDDMSVRGAACSATGRRIMKYGPGVDHAQRFARHAP